ncbi:MAG TPA: hypothetical protein VIA06_25680 [Candidatus Dormibacteraeota bacterium]|nr:hypothetical protein [Candidatus Dormibacteraeota bacterium]
MGSPRGLRELLPFASGAVVADRLDLFEDGSDEEGSGWPPRILSPPPGRSCDGWSRRGSPTRGSSGWSMPPPEP